MQTCRWDDPQGAASIILSCEAIDGIRAQVIEAFLSLPRRGAEVGGLLLGWVKSTDPLHVHVEGFRPVPCEHRFGPSYALSETDRATLETELAAANPAPVGLYRSYTGREPGLDSADRDLVQSYFSGPQNILLLIRPVTTDKCVASFAWLRASDVHISEPFEWGRSPDLPSQLEEPTAPPIQVGQPERPATGVPDLPSQEGAPVLEAPTHERIYPPPSQEEEQFPVPPPPRPTLPPAFRSRLLTGEATAPARRKPRFWVPLLACIVLSIGAAFAYEWWKLGRAMPPPPHPQIQSADRVIPPPKPPEPQPTTPAPQRLAPPPESTAPAAPPARKASLPAPAVAPVAVHKVQPGISEGIRSRIHGRIVIPIEVRINQAGRVTSATAAEKGDGLQQYLADRAVRAARLWRFQPARSRRGARVPAEKTIYFVFTK